MNRPPGVVYLLCFSAPYRHARHYLGFATDLEARLAEHRAGRGARRLIQVITAAGIDFTVAPTWEGDRSLERRLKNGHNAPARLCPLCKERSRSVEQRLADHPRADPERRSLG